MNTYHTLGKGETPSSLAKRFTGDPSRYRDLLSCNRGLKQGVDGRTGAPAFNTCDWRAGTRISIPGCWTREGTVGRVPIVDRAWTPMTEKVGHQWQRSLPDRAYWVDRIHAWLQFGVNYSGYCMNKWNSDTLKIKIGMFVDQYGAEGFASKFSNNLGQQTFDLGPPVGGPSISFYSQEDKTVSYRAARVFAQVHCTASYSKNMPGPTFTLGYPGLVGAVPASDAGLPVTDSTKGVQPTPGPVACAFGTAINEFKSYYYEVQADDISNFWLIPDKFNMPKEKKYWQQLRDANQNWAGGTVKQGEACVLAGLRVGSLLRVPKNWQEPKPGVKVVSPKDVDKDNTKCGDGMVYFGGECIDNDKVPTQPGLTDVSLTDGDSTSTWLALLAVAGLATVGGVYLYKQRNKR